MSFSADWLALREPADAAARAQTLIKAAAGAVPEGGRVVDLGAGRGATMRALAPHLAPGATFELIDHDAALLAEAARIATRPVTTHLADLRENPAPFTGAPDLLSASALFDLASAAFVETVAARCAADRIPLLSLLTYDGVLKFAPAHPMDAMVTGAFNTHQRRTKSFGPALGPGAPAALHDAFAAHGFIAKTEASPWRLDPGPLLDAALAGILSAAREVIGAAADDWARARTITHLVVGHRDQLFVPA
ncbi:MAG: class I SAM-dependent methyltransferase [Pseudomonadota bacterium]